MTSRGVPLDVTFVVSGDVVRLTGAGVDVSAAHGGVRPGLRNALHDVRLERTRRSSMVSRPRDGQTAVRDLALDVDELPGLVSLRRVGELLAESFLPAPVARALGDLLRRAVHDHVALRVGVEAPGLAALPWEALPDPLSGRPLALHPQVVVYRRSTATAPALLAGPLRIVVAIASPDAGGALLDYEHELRAVLSAVRQARRSQARVDVVPFASTAAIRAALDVPGGIHVLHISAHGKPGALVLEHPDGRAREVTAEQLVTEAIPPGRMPPVISLAACYTDADGEAQGSSFAAQLAGRGACAVIGTQTSVTDRYATLFFARVYAELAESTDPDVVRAVADARRLVQQDLVTGTDRSAQLLAGMDEWGVVTLLANAPQVPVIDHRQPRVSAPAERTAAWGRVSARPVGQFVGRRPLQRTLPALLSGDEYAGLVLHGIGGIGKTTLAAEVLRRTLAADPSWRVAALFGPVTVDSVLAAVASTARLELLVRDTVAGPQTAAVQVAGRVDVPWADRLALLHDHVLDEVPILLVLDNFEDNLAPDGRTVADDGLAGLLATWALAPARSRLLITSRHPVALPQLAAVPVGPLSAAEAGKLLWSLPHVDRHAGSDAAAEQVWRVVGGHPRSLEYLDALLGQGQGRFDDITDRLTAAVTTRLGTDAATWLAQDRTLDAALADTVTLAADDVLLTDHLTRLVAIPGAVDLLTAISVYREPVPAVALTFHTGARRTSDDIRTDSGPPDPPYTEPAGLADLLHVLAASSLIHHDPGHEPGLGVVFMHRWTATELHSQWQRTLALDPGKDPLLRAHRTAAAYWQWRVEAWPQDRAADLHDGLEARYHLLAAGDLDAATIVTGNICVQLEATGAWDRATGLIYDTLRWLPTGSTRYPAYIYTLGILAQNRGDYPEAERHYHQALTTFEQLDEQLNIAKTYHQLGNVAYLRSAYSEADRRYQQALTTLEQLDDQAGVASTYHQLGMLAQGRGNYPEAERHYQRALTTFQQLGEQAGVASTYYQLGVLAQNRGNYPEAEHHYHQALTTFEQLGEQASVASTHHQLGNAAYLRGAYSDAERHYQQALATSEQIGDQVGVASTYHQLGMLAQNRGDHPEAERRYQRARTTFEQIGDQVGVASTYHQLGMLAQNRGDRSEAELCYQQALTTFEQIGNQANLASTISQLALLRTENARPVEAVQLHIRAASIRLAIGTPQAVIDLSKLAELRAALGTTAFADAATQVLDNENYTNLIALLDAPTPGSPQIP
ncbi:tetratricopeptide repeat protein [Dactylosporangium sp. NBC_01737]|uniref:tetratricopeptide repeat protein n=1 Tax=Dactylosporangium sp. NBC_01737 TaxID=2975959 RepID=UPI002E150105|nr:tetratricopeptide repeat protein [Dactylosporangium sp. NBC_01737]